MGNQMQNSISDKGNHELLTIFTFEINNFSEKKASFMSPTFLGGGSEWYVQVQPNEKDFGGYLRLYLCVQNPKLLLTGWRTRARYRFVLLNQSGKELYRAAETSSLFCAQFRMWGDRTLPLSKLKEEGFLENNKMIIRVEVKVTEEGYVTGKETFEIKGFEVPSTQVTSVSQLFMKHPDLATDFKLNGKCLKTAYMNLLLEAGFKLDWLKKKLEEVALERKNAFSDGSQVEEVEERIKNLELTLSDLKVELQSEKAKSAAAAAKLLSLDDIL
ncbi:MATH/TRAF domain [Arabidopsis thaliana x Arabidopsis arenosa]|uniref:MATH/TRAF domain n=1 Tax=Arabidopsis thaliana x Arabidopsis arenosa TaxID=1240361 RepID=A0A8T2A9D7_9BRAS|nr:MATH/TRAF domain [Arabidopsis thaliana x Arabidopsis arenosa]